MDHIDVDAGGMFSPQEKGPCKLPLIIPGDDIEAQNFAFTKLRYHKVRVSLVPDGEAADDFDLDLPSMVLAQMTVAQIGAEKWRLKERDAELDRELINRVNESTLALKLSAIESRKDAPEGFCLGQDEFPVPGAVEEGAGE